jgi:hypothetical protein
VQCCPVGNHWSLVTPVEEPELTDKKRRFASEHHDIAMPKLAIKPSPPAQAAS